MQSGGKISDSEIEGILETIGLSAREARVYLVLAREGKLTAAQIARMANLARPEAYEVLHKLETKGFIYSMLGKPAKFEPVDPLTIRNRIMQEERKRLSSVEAGMTKILEVWPFLVAMNNPDGQLPRTATIRGRSRIAAIVEDMITSAQESVRIFTTRRGVLTAMQHNFPEICKKLVDRGVDVKMLLDEGSTKRLSSNLVPENLEVKVCKGPKARFYLVDDRDVLYHLHLQSEEDIWGSDETAMWTDSPDQVNMYRWLFMNEWDQSVPIDKTKIIQRKVKRTKGEN